MNPHDLDQRLSRISTMWTVMRQAHDSGADAAAAARQELMQRYCGAVYRYLISAVRDPHETEDLTQEFALRFIQGRFRHADPARGRFRDYVKTALFHLVDDYRKRQRKGPQHVPLEAHEPANPDADAAEADRAFLESWRQELLARAWKALAAVQEESGQPYYTVLRFRVEHPELQSPQMAERLAAELGKPVTAVALRQVLHRARDRFADLLLQETRRSLGDAGADRLEEELADLNLLKYCQTALQRRDSHS